MNREQIKQTLIDHGVSDIPGALLDALAPSDTPASGDVGEV